MDKVIIKDDQGVERSFTDIRELLAYLDSFQMSFLPDGYEYRVEAPEPEPVTAEELSEDKHQGREEPPMPFLDARDQHLINKNLNKATGGK